MNYLIIYRNLIKKAKKNCKNSEYKEKHHIIPKCFLKHKSKEIFNGPWNIVKLSPREHFIAHLLLWKAMKQKFGVDHFYTIKCLYAVNNFIIRKSTNESEYKVNSRLYSILKREKSQTMSNQMKADYASGKRIVCWDLGKDPRTGKKHTSDSKNKMSLSRKKYIKEHGTYSKEKEKKSIEITYKDGTKELCHGIRNFVERYKEKNYARACLLKVAKGISPYHKDIIGVKYIGN